MISGSCKYHVTFGKTQIKCCIQFRENTLLNFGTFLWGGFFSVSYLRQGKFYTLFAIECLNQKMLLMEDYFFLYLVYHVYRVYRVYLDLDSSTPSDCFSH